MIKKVFGYDYRVTNETIYSSLKKNQKPCLNKILSKLSDINVIIDCNAHIGADTINFANIYKNANLIAIDKNPSAIDCLKYNIEKFSDAKRFTVVCQDVVEWIKDSNKSLIFITLIHHGVVKITYFNQKSVCIYQEYQLVKFVKW